MRVHRGIAMATWVLERLSAGVYGRAIAGDLLEELEAGRSEGWFWRQVAWVAVANAKAALRLYGLPLVFSVGWSLLYPMFAVGRYGFIRRLVGVTESFAWPYSALLEPLLGVLPVVAFVGIGLMIYLSLPIRAVGKVSLPRLLVGLSIGLNVLLVAAVSLLQHGMPHGPDLQVLMVESFYSNVRWVVVGAPLALSLYAAIVCAQPGQRWRVVIG